jgi:uncharacterized protein YoxC
MMSVEIIVSIAIVFLILVIVFTLKNSSKEVTRVQSKDEKREEIFNSYIDRLTTELETIDDKDKRIQRKKELLKEFSSELSRNIFLDASDVRNMIMQLSNY